MKYTKVEEYTITLSFKELRYLKQLVRCAVLCMGGKESATKWVELEPDEIELEPDEIELARRIIEL